MINRDIFDSLFVLEVASNHLGKRDRALEIIRQHSRVVRFNNVRAAIKIAGPLEAVQLRKAFAATVSRHEILRTTFVLNDGSPVQNIAPSLPFALDVSDLSNLEAAAREAAVQRELAPVGQ